MGKLKYSLAPEWNDDDDDDGSNSNDIKIVQSGSADSCEDEWSTTSSTNGDSVHVRTTSRHHGHGSGGRRRRGRDRLKRVVATVLNDNEIIDEMMNCHAHHPGGGEHGGGGSAAMMQIVERRYPRALRRFVVYGSICLIHIFVICIVLRLQPYNYTAPPQIYDLVIFGATPAGCAAAIAAGEMGASVVLLEPSGHVGGMATEGGIGLRDGRNNSRILDPKSSQVRWGMLNAQHYGIDTTATTTTVIWQPDNYVGEASFLTLLQNAGVEIRFNTTFIEGSRGVLLDKSAPLDEPRIHALLLQKSGNNVGGGTGTGMGGNNDDEESESTFSENSGSSSGSNNNNINTNNKQQVDWVRAQFFIDASYDGELMQAAGVSYTIGRESNDTYGESLAGITPDSSAQFPIPISPFLLSDDDDDDKDETTASNTNTTNNGKTSFNQTTKVNGRNNDITMDNTHNYNSTNSTTLLEDDDITAHNKTYYYYTKPADDNLLRYVQQRPDPRQHIGESDDNVMSYSYRVCFTKDPNNTVPVTPPDGYNPDDFELARRLVQAQLAVAFESNQVSRPWLFLDYLQYNTASKSYMKYDACCGPSPFGIDPPGLAVGYANASRAVKQRMAQDHRYFVQGLLWFWHSDPSVPESIREEYASYGLCKDEWTDNGHFPRQLYIREASRMIGDHVFTQNDRTSECRQDSIAVATSFFNIHDVQRVAVPNAETTASVTAAGIVNEENTNNTLPPQNMTGSNETNIADITLPSSSSSWMVMNEGLVNYEGVDFTPFDLPYWIILPKHGEVTNLAVPNCPSVSHVAFSAIRQEPTLWLLGQAAGTAAAIALSHGNPSFHDVDVIRLQQALSSQGSPIHWPVDRTC